MNLPVFVEVLEPLQDFFQNGGDTGLIQHTGLMLTARDDVLDDVQHRAWERASERKEERKTGRGLSQDMLAAHGESFQDGSWLKEHQVEFNRRLIL